MKYPEPSSKKVLGDILEKDEAKIKEEFYVKGEILKKWKEAKGAKKIPRVSKSGHNYIFSEGSMTFPDNLNSAARTIITSEGGKSPSRFKHIIKINNKYRRLVPSELEQLNMFPKNFTSNEEDLKYANCFIITVPTPIDKLKKPDLRPLLQASEMIGKIIKEGDLIIYESTVYPGCTEEVCVPILEKFSNLKFNRDFFCGYSPERINPGDKKHTISNIKKITSGSTPEILDLVDSLYNEIITVGTYRTSSIKVAEAAKVIENTQPDLNENT